MVKAYRKSAIDGSGSIHIILQDANIVSYHVSKHSACSGRVHISKERFNSSSIAQVQSQEPISAYL